MHPELIKIGPLVIHTYGVFVASGFLLALALAVREARKQGISHTLIADLGFYILVSAIVGSRLLYVIMNISFYLERPVEIFKVWEGGLIYYGGLGLAVPVGIWYIKKKRLELWQVADIFAPSIAIGHALGRLGCFSAGCCYGKSTDLPWAVIFEHPKSLAPVGIPVHPVQIYEAIGESAIFLLLITLRKRQLFKGELFWTYGIAYSILRFFSEFLRGDIERGFLFSWLSISQTLSIVVFVVSVVMIIKLINKGKE